MSRVARRVTAWGAALSALLAGCTSFREPYAGGKVAASETVLGGRVELVPPLAEGEQDIRGIQTVDFESRIFLLTDDHPRELQGEPGPGDFEDSIAATLGEPFWLTVPRKPLHVLRAVIVMKTAPVLEMAQLPGGMYVDIQPDDRAVYMGTLRFIRDEFFDVRDVELVDEYDQALADYRSRFEGAPGLEKRLTAPAP